MRYRIKSAYLRNTIAGCLHHVWKRSDGSYYTTNCWYSKLGKGAFDIFVKNVK